MRVKACRTKPNQGYEGRPVLQKPLKASIRRRACGDSHGAHIRGNAYGAPQYPLKYRGASVPWMRTTPPGTAKSVMQAVTLPRSKCAPRAGTVPRGLAVGTGRTEDVRHCVRIASYPKRAARPACGADRLGHTRTECAAKQNRVLPRIRLGIRRLRAAKRASRP